MQVIPLSEGQFTIGHDKNFVPFDEQKDVLTDRPTGSLLVEIQPFLLDTGNDLYLMDTGLGFHLPNGELQIHHNLRQLGYEPEDVTKVILSHLHKDHSSGVLFQRDGKWQPSFPLATHYIYQPEWEYALQQNGSSYNKEFIKEISQHVRINFLAAGKGHIDDYMDYEHSGGHSKEHMVVIFEHPEGNIFFGGDEAPQYKQIKTKYIAKYDFNGRKAMELRADYVARGREKDWLFLFYHDVKKPMSKVDFE